MDTDPDLDRQEKAYPGSLSLHLIEMDTDPDPVSDPDRQALDADPDPVKCCRSDRIRTHNTVSDHLFLLPEGGGHIPEEGSVWR